MIPAIGSLVESGLDPPVPPDIVWSPKQMQAREPEEWETAVVDRKTRGGCFSTGCLSAILLPIILPILLYFMPLPETARTTYPVEGKSGFDVLDHKLILSLGAFKQYERGAYGINRHFRIWIDVKNDRWSGDSVALKCIEFEYRIDNGEWRKAERALEGDFQDEGSARVWYWSPLIHDLDLIDAKRRSHKMRPGRYDLRLVFEAADGSQEAVETTLTLSEKKVRKWTSGRIILEELSGIH